MKKIKLFTLMLFLALTTPLFYQCTTDLEYKGVSKVEPNFSQEAKEWGGLFAKALTSTAKESKKRKIKLRDESSIYSVSEKNTLEIFQKSGYLSVEEKSSFLKSKGIQSKQSYKTNENLALQDVINSNNQKFSSSQKNILNKIENARISSNSYVEFSNKLVEINDAIYNSVPLNEQASLLFVTSTLYYGLDAINELVKDAVLPGKPEKNYDITLAHLQLNFIQTANAESEVEGWWDSWGKCAAGTLGGAGLGALGGAAVGGAGCTVVLPIIGTVACGTVGAIVGGISGALSGAAGSC